MRALLVFATGCTSILGISDPKPGNNGDGGPDMMIDSNIDAPPPCTTTMSLKPEVVSNIGKPGMGFTIGRFNNGTDEDIAVATGADVTLLFGNRTGAFGATAADIKVIPTAATGVVVDDFDTDADDDFAMWTTGGTSVIIRRQNRLLDPPVELEQPITGLTSVQRVINEQLDGNLRPDIMVYDSGAGSRVFTSNIGTPGTFSSGATVGVGADELILLAQIDGAQRSDALFVNGGAVKLSLQTTSFQALGQITNVAASKGIAIGKFDGDALVDLVVSTSNGLVLFRQVAATPGTFQMHGVISPLQSAAPMLVGDLNEDGRDDIVLANAVILQCAPPAAGMPGVFTQVEALSAAPPARLVDVSGDGKADLVRLEGNSIKVRLK